MHGSEAVVMPDCDVIYLDIIGQPSSRPKAGLKEISVMALTVACVGDLLFSLRFMLEI